MKKSTRKTSSTRRPVETPESISEAVARVGIRVPALDDLLEEPEISQLWETLRARFSAEYRDHLSSANTVRLFGRLQAALPEKMRGGLRILTDQMNRDEFVSQQAAYLVGVAIGRRLGGAR
jgi:hypothetical protein